MDWMKAVKQAADQEQDILALAIFAGMIRGGETLSHRLKHFR
jgi:hypothetical protein